MNKTALSCCLAWAAVSVAGGIGVFHVSHDAWFHLPVVLLWGLWVVVGEIVFLTELAKKYDKVAVWIFAIQAAALLVWGLLR